MEKKGEASLAPPTPEAEGVHFTAEHSPSRREGAGGRVLGITASPQTRLTK